MKALTHHVGVGGVREFIIFLQEPPDVVLEALTALSGAPLEVPVSFGVLVGALKIPDEGPSEVGLVMYGVGRQMLEPGPRSFCEVDGEELDDQVVILDPRPMTREEVVL